MDHEENINVILAHDHTIDPVLEAKAGSDDLYRLNETNFDKLKSRSRAV